MNPTTLSAVAAALAFGAAAAAAAQVMPVEWDAAGRYAKALTIAPGQLAEACVALPAGASVAWSFESPAPLDFNIHYHAGEDVHYPVRKGQVARDGGTLAAALAQDYCWMWTNAGAAAATLRVELVKR